MFFDELPNEIKLRIFTLLSNGDLARTARTSLDNKLLSEDDSLWREKLIKDFHFTLQTASLLQSRLSCSYKGVYRYCKEYTFNGVQQAALSEFRVHGLSENHFRGRDWFSSLVHINVLVYLMTNQGEHNLTANQAMLELDSLDKDQAFGIAQGLSRSDVLGLNEPQIGVLIALKAYGLTANHLRGRDWFSHCFHRDALIYLMKKQGERNLTVEQAMAELDGLDPGRVFGITTGLSRSDVLGLNESQIEALFASQDNDHDLFLAHNLTNIDCNFRFL